MPGERILIAEDESFVREICVRAISEDGYQVRGVGSGAEAVEAARGQSFDLFLTDLRMPGMSGLEAFKTIQEFAPDIIGVAMTGYATMENAIQALQLGFHDFILKPFLPQDVRHAVSRALDQRHLREENARLRALIPLYQMTHAFMTIVSLDDLLRKILNVFEQQAGVDIVAVLLFDSLRRELVLRAATGFPADLTGLKAPIIAGGALERALAGEEPLIWTEDQVREFPFASDLNTLVTVPLMAQAQKLGLLVVGKQAASAPLSYGDLELLSVLAAPAAVAIKNTQLFEEIQHAYKKVEESDYLKSEFIAIASHELRTPLVSILGYVEMLTYEAKGEMLEQLNIVLEQALRLRDIVNDMLSLTDLRAGMTEIVWDVISSTELLTKALEALGPEMEAKKVQVNAEIAPSCQRMRGDSERLILVLSKLLSNAVKFSPPGERVRVVAHQEDGAAIFSITDRGPGISPEAQQKLFQPFYQEQESLRRTHSGMGLGLSIAKGMIELHGGKIWVESKAGKGSTFSFSIPQPVEG